MKKFSKILFSLVAVVMAFGFAGCGNPTSIYNKDAIAEMEALKLKPITTATKIDSNAEFNSVLGGVYASYSRETSTDTSVTTYKGVYNLETKQVVKEWSVSNEIGSSDDTIEVSSFDFDGNIFFNANVVIDEKMTCTLIDTNGSVLLSCDNSMAKVQDLIKADKDYYRLDEVGVWQKVYSGGGISADLPSFSYSTDKYYYFAKENADDELEEIYAYDKDFKQVFSYKVPSFAENVVYGYLEDGNILLQYEYVEENLAEDYTYLKTSANPLEADKKMIVDTFILNVKSNKVKEIKVDYILLSVMPNNEENTALDKSIKNVAYINKVEDKRILDDSHDLLVVDLSNGGKVNKGLNRMFPGQQSDLSYLVNGYYCYMDLEWHIKLVDSEGKMIGDITNAEGVNGINLFTEDKIYDYNLAEVKDMNEYTFMEALNRSAIYRAKESGNMYLCADGIARKIASITDGEIYVSDYDGKIYVIEKADGTYKYFDDLGVELLTTKANLECVGTLDDGRILFSGLNSETETNETYLFS